MSEIQSKLFTSRLELTLLDGSSDLHVAYLKEHFRYVARDNKNPEIERYAAEALEYAFSKGFARLHGASLGRPLWYLIANKATPTEFVGFISMINRSQTTDEGWAIATPYQRKGYATEAAREVLRYCTQELGMNEIWAAVDPHNTASQKVAESCGFIKTPTTVRTNSSDGPEVLCYMLPGMKPFPQDSIYLRRGDNAPLELPSIISN